MSEDRRSYLKRVGPLLVATAIACSAAAGSLTNTLDEPAFEFLLHAIILVAVGASAVAGSFGRSSTMIGVIVIAVGIAGLTQRSTAVTWFELLYPADALADADLTWATLWSWLMVGFCFMLGRRRNVLFPLVAGLAIFGLVSTVNINPIILVYFAIFVFGIAFIWGYEHLLNVGERIAEGPPQDWLSIARTQALAGTMLVTVLIVSGLLLGSGLYAIGPRLFVGRRGMGDYARYLQRSLLSYGGMSDVFQVGQGPVNLPSTPAISVEADKPALWRGSAYDYYTGDGWTRELTGSWRLRSDEDGWWHLPGTDNLVGERNVQRVTLLDMDSRAIYAAAVPVKFRMIETPGEGRSDRFSPQLDRYRTIATQYVMPTGTEYEVVSVMPSTDPETLRNTSSEYPSRIVETYVNQMQVQAEAELSGLVDEITAGAETPYDQVEAIRQFLGSTCVYSTRAPAVPRGDDAAVWFITNQRRGACDLFATSLAVMARLAGVPARVATGFQTGSYDPEEGAYVALQSDAHAWAEIYFVDIGWVPFDVAAEQVDEGRDMWAWLSEGAWRRPIAQFMERVGSFLFTVLLIVALISAVLGPGVIMRWLRGRTRRRTPRQRLGEAFERFRRKAARVAGLRPQRWRTPAELQSQLAHEGVAASPAVREKLFRFTDRFYDYRYGPEEPTAEEIRAIRAQARELIRALRRDLRSHGRRKDGDSQ